MRKQENGEVAAILFDSLLATLSTTSAQKRLLGPHETVCLELTEQERETLQEEVTFLLDDDLANEVEREHGAQDGLHFTLDQLERFAGYVAQLVFITTPDDAIEEVCRGLADRDAFAAGSVVAHCSGALPSTILQPAALKIGEAAGMPREEALGALLPLIRGTVSNLEQVGIPAALTGPIARGDVETTRRHVQALKQSLPDLLPLYQALAAETIEVALAKGTLDAPAAARLRELLSG